MRIAYVHSYYSSEQPSGENAAVDAEIAALRRAGQEVQLFAARTDDLARRRFYPLASAAQVASGFGRSPLDDLRRCDPDIVHVHNLFPNFGDRWLSHVEAPIVHTVHNFRHLCAAATLYRDGEVCHRCLAGSPVSAVLGGCYRGSRLASVPVAVKTRGGPSRNRLLHAASRVLVLSGLAKDLFIEQGVPDHKLQITRNFVPADLDTAPGPRIPRQGWVFAGRLSPEKGIRRLVERWPADVSLTVIGDGPDREATIAAAEGKLVDFVGTQARATVRRLMERAVGVVVPSRCYEGAPLVYLEALSAGTPVLAFHPCSLTETIVSEGTGASATWDEDLADVVRRADAGFRQLNNRCRDVFEAQYSERAFVESRLSLYESLLS